MGPCVGNQTELGALGVVVGVVGVVGIVGIVVVVVVVVVVSVLVRHVVVVVCMTGKASSMVVGMVHMVGVGMGTRRSVWRPVA